MPARRQPEHQKHQHIANRPETHLVFQNHLQKQPQNPNHTGRSPPGMLDVAPERQNHQWLRRPHHGGLDLPPGQSKLPDLAPWCTPFLTLEGTATPWWRGATPPQPQQPFAGARRTAGAGMGRVQTESGARKTIHFRGQDSQNGAGSPGHPGSQHAHMKQPHGRASR